MTCAAAYVTLICLDISPPLSTTVIICYHCLMNVFVCHSTAFDFKSELYEPLKSGLSGSHNLVLPHEAGADYNSKETITTCDFVIAEVSLPSTGQGIELGWADAAGIPIICIHKAGSTPSSALHHVTLDVMQYSNYDELIEKLKQVL